MDFQEKIMFLCFNTNDRAGTVLHTFKNAVATHDLPSRIRGDQGTENYDVAWYMLSHPQRGPDRQFYCREKLPQSAN